MRSVGPSRLQLTLLTAALTPPSSPSSLTTGSRPGLEPPRSARSTILGDTAEKSAPRFSSLVLALSPPLKCWLI